MVAIESAVWRCARWTSPCNVIVGNARCLACCEVFLGAHRGTGSEALEEQKPVGRNAQCCVVMKPAPTPTFVVSQPQLLLQILVVTFDAPTHVCMRHELLQRGIVRQVGEIVFQRVGIVGGLLDEQPLLGTWPRLAGIAARVTYAHCGETATECFVRTLAPTERGEGGSRQ